MVTKKIFKPRQQLLFYFESLQVKISYLWKMCTCVCLRACACVCVCVCVAGCVCVCIFGVAIPLTADHFSSVVNINFMRVSGSAVDTSVFSSSFLLSAKRRLRRIPRRALWCLLILKPVKVGTKASVIWEHLSQVIPPLLRCIPFLLPSLEAVLSHDLL